MREVLAVLILVSIGLGLRFVVSFGLPWRNEFPAQAWLQSGLAWVAIIVDTLLLLALFHVPVSAWAGVVVLVGQDTVFAWRLVVLRRNQRDAERASRDRS